MDIDGTQPEMDQRTALTHLIETLASRRNVTSTELQSCVAEAVQMSYAYRDRCVWPFLTEIDGQLLLDGYETILGPDGRLTCRAVDLRPPTSDELIQAVDAYLESPARQLEWRLVEGRVISIQPDHYLLAFEDETSDHHGQPSRRDQTAVLPKAAAGDRPLAMGQGAFACVRKHTPEIDEGLPPWRLVQAHFIATREDPEFVTQVLRRLSIKAMLRVVVYARATMLIVSDPELFRQLIANKSAALTQLCMITGMRRMFVAPGAAKPRDPSAPATQEQKRILQAACRSVTGLFCPDHFHVVPPQVGYPPDHEKGQWKIYYAESVQKRFFGTQGCNLYFIMVLSGMRFQHELKKGVHIPLPRSVLAAQRQKRSQRQVPPPDSGSTATP